MSRLGAFEVFQVCDWFLSNPLNSLVTLLISPQQDSANETETGQG